MLMIYDTAITALAHALIYGNFQSPSEAERRDWQAGSSGAALAADRPVSLAR